MKIKLPKGYTSDNCINCRLCKIVFVKKILDNEYYCRGMKYKSPYKDSGKPFGEFDIHTMTPKWCPLPKREESEAVNE